MTAFVCADIDGDVVGDEFVAELSNSSINVVSSQYGLAVVDPGQLGEWNAPTAHRTGKRRDVTPCVGWRSD